MYSPTISRWRQRVVLALAVSSCAVAARGAAVLIKTNDGTGADAEVREETPELVRQPLAAGDLSVRANSTTNHVAFIRFDLAAKGITSSSQLLGYADLRLFNQQTSIAQGNQEGVKIYGLSP